MGRTFGDTNNTTTSEKVENVTKDVSTKNIKDNLENKSGKKRGCSIGCVFGGCLLGIVLSVGGYFGYTAYFGKAPTLGNIIVKTAYADVFENHGITLQQDFLQSSFVGDGNVTLVDVNLNSIADKSLELSSIDTFIPTYAIDKVDSNGSTICSLSCPTNSIVVTFEDNELTAFDYTLSEDANMDVVPTINVCGISNKLSLEDILAKFGKPSYVSVSDTFSNDAYVSVSLTYVFGDSNVTINLNDKNDNYMRIVSLSYAK